MYAITSLAAENMMLMYHRLYGLASCSLRITNTYGPRHQMKKPYGIVNWFIRRVLDNEPIEVMGEGKILRDVLFVDDCVEAFLLAATNKKSHGQVFNVASGKGISFAEIAKAAIKASGSGRYKLVPYANMNRNLEPGSFIASNDKIRKALGWKPKTALADGLAATINFYRKNKQHYW